MIEISGLEQHLNNCPINSRCAMYVRQLPREPDQDKLTQPLILSPLFTSTISTQCCVDFICGKKKTLFNICWNLQMSALHLSSCS